MAETLQELEYELLDQLRDIGRVGKPGFLEDEDDDDVVVHAAAKVRRPKAKTKGKKQRGR